MLGVILLTLVASALGAPTTPAGGSTTRDLIAAGTSSFNALDKNKNGHVEVSEFLISFDKSDTNHDNEMSIQEYVQYRHATKTFTQALYKFLDTDHDGSVSRAEMIRLFRLYDGNKDGIVTLPEFIRGYLKIMDIVAKNLSQ
ncbi:calmodulin-4-like [Haliotis rufescens]|uniref:calmodulin-4-like n=1 Tax=Haliotis rufescens TaxID=6454 RepID=UPI00201F5D23|nr:calmodulin-4-like [Haliotis rufescens]